MYVISRGVHLLTGIAQWANATHVCLGLYMLQKRVLSRFIQSEATAMHC